MQRVSFKMGYLLIACLWVMHILDVVGTRTAVRRLLYHTLDYRDCYIIRSGGAGSNKFKWGIGYDAAGRAKQIDRSIPGTKEKLLNHWRLFHARYWEGKIRKEIAETNFRYRGSGKTEWHKFRGLLVKGKLIQLRWRVRGVWLYQQLLFLSCQILALLALLCLLRANYPDFF